MGFRRFGLDADRGDITIVAAGQEPERIAALSVPAPLPTPWSRRSIATSSSHWVSTCSPTCARWGIPWETASVVTTAKNMQSKRDMMERVVRALLQANTFLLNPAKRSRVVDLMTAQLVLKTPQEAAAIDDDLIKFYIFKKPYPTGDGFANVIAEVTKSLPKAAGIKYQDVVDAVSSKRSTRALYKRSVRPRLAR